MACNNRDQLLMRVYETGFALDDILLYLDTHPQDPDGLQMVKQMARERKKLLGQFAGKCYPLTFDCMADLYGESPDTDCYCWEKGPVPWEAVCG